MSIDTAAALRACDGGFRCKAIVHIHGCYSDDGSCNYPIEHERSSAGAKERHD